MSEPTKEEIAEWSEDRLAKMLDCYADDVCDLVLVERFDEALELAKVFETIRNEMNTR